MTLECFGVFLLPPKKKDNLTFRNVSIIILINVGIQYTLRDDFK